MKAHEKDITLEEALKKAPLGLRNKLQQKIDFNFNGKGE